MKKRAKLIAFMNAYSQGKSGGDMVFIEVAKRLKDYDKVVVTSLLGEKLCQENGLREKYLITTRESEFRNVIWTYFRRTVKAFFLKLKIKNKDILLGTSDFLPDVLPIFWLKVKNPKAIWVQHIFHLIPSSRKIPFLAQKINFLLIKNKVDLVIIDNSLLKNDLINLGFSENKIMANSPGVDIKKIEAFIPSNAKYDCVFLGRLNISKGIFDLIEIWKILTKKNPNISLAIIGSGNKKIEQQLKNRISENNLEKNIDILGFLEDKKAFGILKSSKVFVFPSHEEGFGIAPLEAQACGLPVVAWNLPAFEEVFPKGMIKVKIGNIEKFASKVIELIANKQLYQELAEEAIYNASRYDWDKVAKRELYLLEKVKKSK